jgi:alpha-amylase/alpha-mannosidase (GH57 family)
MSDGTLRLAILWHMHQPYYRDSLTGKSAMPWVRLHAVKDYHPMAAMLRAFPDIRVTINVVPSLIQQIQEYTDGGLRDVDWDLAARPAKDLGQAERVALLERCFLLNVNAMVRPHQRYAELLEKRGRSQERGDLERVASLFSVSDFLDLQVWFNLVWFHPLTLAERPELARLLRKGRHFCEEEKQTVLQAQLEVMAEVIPLYRSLADDGRIELCTSPYYHPILPLLISTENARESMPQLALEPGLFSRPDDAELHLSRAVDFHRQVFGRAPAGLWPSEGSVSEDLIPLVIRQGFRWLATDEEILYHSLRTTFDGTAAENDRKREETLYQPYRISRDGGAVTAVFRDHALSDAVGFSYYHWDSSHAGLDLAGRIESIRQRSAHPNPVVTLVLDGENPWEHYHEQGLPFLRTFYQAISSNAKVRAVTVGEACEGADHRPIGRVFAGSWINHDFRIWIGHREDQRAYTLLARARKALQGFADTNGTASPAYRNALEEILIAEGSDWCWWYGEENSSAQDDAFDRLFRQHLMNVYTILGAAVPDELQVSILSGRKGRETAIKIFSFANPKIDGRVSSYFEWLPSWEFLVEKNSSSMHRAEHALRSMHIAFNRETLFVRLDPHPDLLRRMDAGSVVTLHVLTPVRRRIVAAPLDLGESHVILSPGEGRPGERRPAAGLQAALVDIVELAVPFGLIGVSPGETFDFFVSLQLGEHETGQWPQAGALSLTVPDDSFESHAWST